MKIIDLRSDTVTRPNEEMRRAMYDAEVADDTYDGDPTVAKLEELASRITGKEAALFVASGTMGNLIGVLCNTLPGREVILGDKSHQFLWEVGGIARIANCVTHTIPFNNGFLDPMDIRSAVRLAGREATTTGLICVENTSNFGGGLVIPPEHLEKIANVARENDLPVHMDGARFFNAVIASERPASDFTKHVDTLSFCLSKGLGAPFGGLICGTHEHIEKAIGFRQLLGGGMRQAGIMAAAGIVALTKGLEGLEKDHRNAKKLAMGLANLYPGICNPEDVETNLFFIKTSATGLSGQALTEALRREGILVFMGDPYIRLATHCMIDEEDVDTCLKVFSKLI
ncbi:MAG: aminotransferase class I/II-fold pyridoxal phosphate-dependent enzyme [Anaerolineaceae bacterium]|nr:aminotransferase class I/II-fold pyridoxal phosphate-dependent enzyme [Anaerolineaceae bacterium]